MDGLSHSLFSKKNSSRTAKIFKDLWSIDLNTIDGIQACLTSRLIALNKVFPDTPNRKQMRPILICSPLQKILEVRFYPKLASFLDEKISVSQTGFVRGMGIQVNLYRGIQRIKERTEKHGEIFGLFIDFANAYNHVPHTLLFDKLRQKKCLEEEEIQFLECLYANYRIRIGNKIIRYNKGVAQGSILSPALFDIFIDDLVEQLNDKLSIKLSVEDILLYADDVLLLCSTTSQVKECISIIEDWCNNNGMELNKKKIWRSSFCNKNKKEHFIHEKYKR